MRRRDYQLLSATLKAVRDSYAPHWDGNLFRACNDNAKAIARALKEDNPRFEQWRFLVDAGATAAICTRCDGTGADPKDGGDCELCDGAL